MNEPVQERLFAAESLQDAQVKVRAGMVDGIACPCCGQLCKLYKRRLNQPMALALAWLVWHHETDPRWYHIREFPLIQNVRAGRDFGRLTMWDFLISKPVDPEKDQKSSGYWKPTGAGVTFVKGFERCPAYVYVFDNKVEGWSENHVTIKDVLGVHFSYRDTLHILEDFTSKERQTSKNVLQL